MPATAQEWRQHARDVEQGTRTPPGATTRLLTETAFAQHAHSWSAVDLIRFRARRMGGDSPAG